NCRPLFRAGDDGHAGARERREVSDDRVVGAAFEQAALRRGRHDGATQHRRFRISTVPLPHEPAHVRRHQPGTPRVPARNYHRKPSGFIRRIFMVGLNREASEGYPVASKWLNHNFNSYLLKNKRIYPAFFKWANFGYYSPQRFPDPRNPRLANDPYPR